MQYKREISDRIARLAASFPAVVITGARQVGKTSLLRELFPSYRYVSLDLPSIAALAENNPSLFLSENPGPILVDEIQYAPALFRHLKVTIDKNRHAMGQYILTGSQKFTLMKEVSDSLAGRAAVCELEPLSVTELSAPPEAPPSIAAILTRGCFPELWRNRALDRDEFYRSYISTYLERDVRQALDVGNLRDFERFIRSCAYRHGQLLNKTEIARDVGIDVKTAGKWLSVLEASNQITLLEPYFRNRTKTLIKSPKIYLNDPGLHCFLIGIDQPHLSSTPTIGCMWEGLVLAELRKWREAKAPDAHLWFYRDTTQLEVDILIEHQNVLTCIECKWVELPDARDARSLIALHKLAPHQNIRLLIASPTSQHFPLTDEIMVESLSSLRAALSNDRNRSG
jgi:hypothetical protein